MAELCELEGAPSNLQGQSLVPLLQNPDAPWDHLAVTQVTRRNAAGPTVGYSVRTERYRYTMWSGGSDGEELYDYQTDPRELKNLADDSSMAALKFRLRSLLERIAGSRRMRHSVAQA